MTFQHDDFTIPHGKSFELPRLAVVPTRHGFYQRYGKRILDLALVLLAAPIVVPVVLILAAFLASDGANPFYAQKRVGRNGRMFTMWKLRTMVPDAEKLLERYLAENDDARREWEVKQKLSYDPRITVFGQAIRRTSLDELPQLFNVLIGDMSLVGPRPMLPEQTALYPGRSYYALRPGLSGFWQIMDRNNSSFAARADYDDRYGQRLSLLTDIWVMAKTITVVLRGTGC